MSFPIMEMLLAMRAEPHEFTSVKDFTPLHPEGVFVGTYLHDDDLQRIESPKAGQCVGYYGAKGRWYIYDETNVIRVSDDSAKADSRFLKQLKEEKGYSAKEARRCLAERERIKKQYCL